MADHKAELRETLRQMEIATGEAAASCLPGLLARLRRHEAGLPGHPLIRPWRRWRIRRLAGAVAEARWHVEQGRRARLGGLSGRG
ncbi:hypothetical protein [Methylobacterium sp. WL120]|uniref:hypothetical protein n=1 Tax=Methylobacterium sp. WL120 TaxID=2603887 RepID=UPI0011CA1DBB|nr:hypothetical protein [Methylobacterium sp. WL120]TXM70551.1 hypothetical protein FV229_02075 [Methylobacterium sp. WL120]